MFYVQWGKKQAMPIIFSIMSLMSVTLLNIQVYINDLIECMFTNNN